MKILSVRTGIYIGLLLISAIVIEWKKAEVSTKKAQEVVSVLSLLNEEGPAVEVKDIVATDIFETRKVTLELCDNQMPCFYESRSLVKQLKPGLMIQDPHSGKTIGQVSHIASHADLSNGLYKIAVRLSETMLNKNNPYFVSEIVTRTKKGVIAVPLEVLQKDQEGHFLWLAVDQKPQRRNVVVGLQNSREAEITKGLNTGDAVIISGANQAIQFNKLKVINSTSTRTPKRG